MHSWGSCEGRALSISRHLQGISDKDRAASTRLAGAPTTRLCSRCLGRTQARKAGKFLLFLNILAPKDAPDSLKMCLESESSCLVWTLLVA